MKKKQLSGNLCGFFCALVWGSTFLVSKQLLLTYTPEQVMLMRFLLAYLSLWLMHPHWYFSPKDEFHFLLMSLVGNTLYYLAENTALLYTYSANVSILVSAAPILTVLLLLVLHRDRHFPARHFLGIGVSFAGVILVVLNGVFVLHLSLLGDLLSLGAACCWAIYSLLLEKMTGRFSSSLISRKLMFYGILTTLPLLIVKGAAFPLRELLRPDYIIGLLFLGLVGSALCYNAWNYACANLGIVMANMYIYAIPFVTLLSGAVFLGEPITVMAIFGAVLITAGLVISAGSASMPEDS